MATSSTVSIEAAKLWNNTGIPIVAGSRYRFAASGTWIDGDIPCGPAGYRSPNFLFELVTSFRRYPRARWFELVGAFDADINTAFRIGTGKLYTAVRSGNLTCFANDLSFLYGNNQGSVQLTVTRID